MLTPRQKELVKATVPVLREHGVALTSHFYKRMLSGNPEVKNLFNQAHQAKGHQQRALAAAVLAYAENIDDPTPLLPAVRHIAVKHCTIGVRAEQYGIVGRHLLASIREVLGEAATDELVDAWAAAYQQLADILIGAENGIYQEQAMAEGGWAGWRPFRVVKREDSADVASFYLKPADGGPVPAHLPGQFVSVRAFIDDLGLVQPRQYTLSACAGDDVLRISVKREAPCGSPKGAMSNHLHDRLHEGGILEVSAPLGDFVLREGKSPVVFLSAGIGITPMVAMLGALARQSPERDVRFIHVARDAQHIPHMSEVESLITSLPSARLQVFYTRPGEDDALRCCAGVGRPDAASLKALNLPADAEVYLCGPVPFMDAQRKALVECGIPHGQIHHEVFGTGEMACA